jgi:integrase/recombinase XerD
MSDNYSTDSNAELIADKFNRNTDPLEEFEPVFQELLEDGVDPLEEYLDRIQRGATDNTDGTIDNYDLTFRRFRNHMEAVGRHWACPNKRHVLEYIDKELETCFPSTVNKRVDHLSRAYRWWQASEEFPHPIDYNPFESARAERDLTDDKGTVPPNVSLDEIRDVVQGIEHVADRAIIGTHLKWGCRSSELANIKLSEIHIDHPEVLEHYSEMGTHEMLKGRPNAVYIPPERDLNKRERPTVLPLDEEVRRMLIDWLLVRPDTGDEWLFMTHKGKQLSRTDLRYIWTKYWWPEYEFADDERYRSVTPHFARHKFTTYWQRDVAVNREKDKYMRGDVTDTALGRTPDALDRYVHTYYEDVKDVYLEEMYQLYI